jgi:hypothetical protein
MPLLGQAQRESFDVLGDTGFHHFARKDRSMDEKLFVIPFATMLGVIVAQILCRPRQSCPDCKAQLPRISWNNVRSFWWGGWICPNCHCEIDRNGQKMLSRAKT